MARSREERQTKTIVLPRTVRGAPRLEAPTWRGGKARSQVVALEKGGESTFHYTKGSNYFFTSRFMHALKRVYQLN